MRCARDDAGACVPHAGTDAGGVRRYSARGVGVPPPNVAPGVVFEVPLTGQERQGGRYGAGVGRHRSTAAAGVSCGRHAHALMETSPACSCQPCTVVPTKQIGTPSDFSIVCVCVADRAHHHCTALPVPVACGADKCRPVHPPQLLPGCRGAVPCHQSPPSAGVRVHGQGSAGGPHHQR